MARRRSSIVAALAAALSAASAGAQGLEKPPETKRTHLTIERVCDLIALHAPVNNISRDFLARLIWKESRFDPGAVSPAGAQGIAQFMPGTAALRGLDDPFDAEKAIPASAKYLGELARAYGNLGLAAAAYNAGEARVSRWLTSGGFLPLETEDYVLDIMGEPADVFTDAAYKGAVRPLDPKKQYDEACRAMPATMSATIPMASVHVKPWGVQVAGNFRRAAAIRQYQRLKGRIAMLAKYEPVVSRVRSPRGWRGIYAVRIGADSRSDADKVCRRLRDAGGSCVVMRNR